MQHKNYHLFWTLLKSVDTLSVGDQRGIVELRSTLAEVTKPQTPLGDCAFEALCLSLLGGRVPYLLPFLFLLCPSGSLSIYPSQLITKTSRTDGHLLEFATGKAMGHSSCPSLPGTEQGVGIGCQVTYPQTTGQGQGIVACREVSKASLKGWFLNTAPCTRFCVSTCVPGFLLSLRTRKSKKSEGDFKLLRCSLGSPVNHPPGGAGDHLPQNS